MYVVYGADLSLTHGSIVRVNMNERHVVTYAEIVYKWDKKDSHRLSLKSTPAQLFLKVRDIFLSFTEDSDTMIYLAVDWAIQSIFWRSKKMFAMQMGMFLGMMYTTARQKDINLYFTSPATLRKNWGLKGNAPKQDLQDAVLELYPLPEGFKQYADEDDIDAYILAIYTIFNNMLLHKEAMNDT